MRRVAGRLKWLWSGSVQWCQARTQISASASISAISRGWWCTKKKENTQSLRSASRGPITRIVGGSSRIFSRAYSVSSRSYFSIALKPPIDSIYSRLARRLRAPTICGVPGSNRCGRPATSYPSRVTELIAPPPQNAGSIIFRRSFLP